MTSVTQILHHRPAPVPSRQRVAIVLTALPLAAVLTVGLRLIGGWMAPSAVVDAPAPAFVAYALGRLPQAAGLLAAPEEGAALAARLPAGARVRIGGRVVGFGRGEGMLWVSAEIDGVAVYGFLESSALRLEAGKAPPLDLSGVPIAALLSPDAGIRMVPLALSGAEVPGGAAASARGVALATSAEAEVAEVGAAELGVAEVDIAWLPETLTPWLDLFEAAGARHRVDPELLAIIALVESGGDPGARSGAGAMGLMQVMPGTAADIARWRGIQGFKTSSLNEPALSIDFGAWYLARQLATFGLAEDPDWRTSVMRAAAAYNGGPGSVSGWLQGRALPAEAERYRTYVSGMWAERRAANSPAYERWLRAGGGRLVAAAAERQAGMSLAAGGADEVLSASARTAAIAAGAVALTGSGPVAGGGGGE